MELEKIPPTDAEIEELKKFLHFLGTNMKREPLKITIQFQHKRFSDNQGFATINIPRHKGTSAMRYLVQALENEAQELLKITQ